MEKYNVSCEFLLKQGILELEFYDELEKMWGNLILRNNLENLLTFIRE